MEPVRFESKTRGKHNQKQKIEENTSSTKGSVSKIACTFAASRARSSRFKRSENASASQTPMT